MTAIIGPDGAGKTTLLRLLCGLLPSTSGSLAVAGVNLRTARTQARANIGYVAQKFSLYPTMTVDENLSFYGGVYGLSDSRLQQRLSEEKQQFQLTEAAQVPAEQLPGGYKLLLPMAQLSGFATPVDNMPELLQYATYANPLRFAIEAVRCIYLEGATLSQVAHNFPPMLAVAAITMPTAAWLFRNKLS